MSDTLVPRSATVYTPPSLAAAIVGALGDQPGAIWFDPCVGDGVFTREAANVGVQRERIVAMDIAECPAPGDEAAVVSRGLDFVDWASRQSPLCDRLVMNPPYVPISRLRGRVRAAALAVRTPDGRGLSASANYWCAFVLRSVQIVSPNGSMAMVLPAAWDYTRYAQPVRDAVFNAFSEVEVYRSAKPLFASVLDGSIVVVARGRGGTTRRRVRIEVPDGSAMISMLRSSGAAQRKSAGRSVVHAFPRAVPDRVRLGDLATIRIGGVTGDSKYFLMTEDERVRRKIPREAMRPVLSRCRHLSSAAVDHDSWDRLLKDGERVWLFCPPTRVLDHPAVRAYLAGGVSGLCGIARYKIARREPWYHTPLPRRIDAFVSGMSRNLPFLVMRAMPRLSATNTLYVVGFRKLLTVAQRHSLGISLLTSAARRELAQRARVYADGLLKVEPGDLADIRLPLPAPGPGAEAVFTHATGLLLAGQWEEASLVADRWVEERSIAPAVHGTTFLAARK